MSSLFGTMSIALRAMMAQQGALETTSNNIANVNTPGYARQRTLFRQEPPLLLGTLMVPTGMTIDKIEGIRDQILELRLHQEKQQEGFLEAFLSSATQVEAVFNEIEGVGLEGVLTEFFNSILSLSTTPSSLPARQGVLTAAGNLADSFNGLANTLTTLQTSLDGSVRQSVNEINQVTGRIAALNKEVAPLSNRGQDAGALEDERTQLIRDLAELIDISVIDARDGSLTITTSSGTALVVGDQNFTLQTQVNSVTNRLNVFAGGVDITARISGGGLGGQIDSRDRLIASFRTDLDTLAENFATQFNTIHTSGFDLNGAAGVNFFTFPSGPGAAAGLSVVITGSEQVAASATGAAGDNSTALQLVDLRNQAIVSGKTPLDFYSGLVLQIGNEVASARAELEAEGLVLRQLENQRSNISSVSLDEEAVNLLRFQRAFEASARVVAVVDQLMVTAINLGRN